jgi:hypothetical protein
MKRSQFTEMQIVSILNQVDNWRSIKELFREHGISETIYHS